MSDERTIRVDVENVVFFFYRKHRVEANKCKILLFIVKLDLVIFRCSYISSRPCVQGVNFVCCFVVVFHLPCFMSVFCCIVQETYKHVSNVSVFTNKLLSFPL